MRHRKRIAFAMRDTSSHKRHVVHRRNRIPNSLWLYADAVAFYISMGYVQEVAEKKTRGKAKNPNAEPDAIAEDTAEDES